MEDQSWLNRAQAFLGELARPFSIYAGGLSVAATPIIIVCRIAPEKLDLVGGAALATAVGASFAVIFGAKSMEAASIAKQNANVQIAQAAPASAPPPS